jgi:hypothetical protein
MNKTKTIIRVKLLIKNARRALNELERELQGIIESEEKHD